MLRRILALLALAVIGLPAHGTELNIKDYGAVADRSTDCTAAIQRALDTASASGGGRVLVPVGNWLVRGHLQVPPNTALVGEWEAPPAPTPVSAEGRPAAPDLDPKSALLAGSVLLATEGAGSDQGDPFILLTRNATLKGLVVYYPNQVPEPEPVPYPWTVAGIGDNASIIDCLLVNPYRAVDFGTRPCGRHLIRGLYAQAIKTGLFVDKCYDVGRLENIHFWPFWSAHVLPGGSAKLDEWMLKNSTAFILSRSDWEYVSNCFCIQYHTGFHFKQSAPDGPGNYLLSQSGADCCDIAVNVEETQGHSGISFSNSQIFGRVLAGEKNHGPIRFTSCGFFGASAVKAKPDGEVITVAGHGRVSMDNCHFYAIAGKTATPIFIHQVGGRLSVSNSLYIVNTFLDPIPLVVEKGAITTFYVQNEHYTSKRVVNKKGKSGRVVIRDNVYGNTR